MTWVFSLHLSSLPHPSLPSSPTPLPSTLHLLPSPPLFLSFLPSLLLPSSLPPPPGCHAPLSRPPGVPAPHRLPHSGSGDLPPPWTAGVSWGGGKIDTSQGFIQRGYNNYDVLTFQKSRGPLNEALLVLKSSTPIYDLKFLSGGRRGF